LPRPQVWLTDHFKPGPMDSPEEKVRKERTYAQIITFCPERPVQFDIKLLDWPTLKEGLKNLIQTCGANTNWSTRYLTDA
jgi:hypothetical protein